jgi:hypothetical protein
MHGRDRGDGTVFWLAEEDEAFGNRTFVHELMPPQIFSLRHSKHLEIVCTNLQQLFTRAGF